MSIQITTTTSEGGGGGGAMYSSFSSSSSSGSTSPTTTTSPPTSLPSSSSTQNNTQNNNNNNNNTQNNNQNNTNNNTTTVTCPSSSPHIKIQHYFNYSTIMRDKEACQCFLEYLTQVTHCDENLLYLLQLENVKSLRSVPHMMEQTQSLIDTFVKLESPKELNITDKMRMRIVENFEDVKSFVNSTNNSMNESKMSNVNVASEGNTMLTPEILWTKIQHAFNELTVQINLQLKQDSFESYLSSDFFEKFIIKKVREKIASHSQQHEKTKKKRSSSLFPNAVTSNTTNFGNSSPNLGDHNDSSSLDDLNNSGDHLDSNAVGGGGGDNHALGAANLMKRFVGGLFKGGSVLQQNISQIIVNHGNNSQSPNLDDSTSTCTLSNTSEISSPILTSDSDSDTSLTASLSSLFKHRGNDSRKESSSQNETVEIMKNIIQDLYKQLIQKDNEIKRLQEVLKQHGQLMGIGGERKAKPLPTAPKQQQSQDDLSLTSPRKAAMMSSKGSSTPSRASLSLESPVLSNTSLTSGSSGHSSPRHPYSASHTNMATTATTTIPTTMHTSGSGNNSVKHFPNNSSPNLSLNKLSKQEVLNSKEAVNASVQTTMNKPQFQLKNISTTTSPNTNNNNNGSSTPRANNLNNNNNNTTMTTPRSSNNNSNTTTTTTTTTMNTPRSSGHVANSTPTNRSMATTTTATTNQTKNVTSNNTELVDSPMTKQKKMTLDIVSSMNNKNSTVSSSPVTSSPSNASVKNDNLPLSQRLQFFEKLSNNTTNSASPGTGNVVSSSSPAKRPQSVLYK
ncbi:hypothetical protein C9374_005987 [Naegleria lovaniensis]|uniref:RGS domain-containing protein n=1 Tax=Naegleria lovaniensis TaxID=51637 RepID=A0AA88KJA3_NAELO|nr:uncharacterized protein C9374_005987 [Naegleria lovaniensis]KAG2381603.1 hypothetical protein C9374_005987 [Naegleria lovaniensis]